MRIDALSRHDVGNVLVKALLKSAEIMDRRYGPVLSGTLSPRE